MMVAALALVSCTKHELDPLTGVFPEATVVELNSLTSCVAEKDAADRRVFTLDLTDGSTPMHLTLIGNKYYLTTNQYTEALDAVAQNGNFVLGKSSVGGKNIKQGYINVDLLEENETADGCENTYSIAAVVFLEDGTPYKANWTGKIAFEKDAVLAPDYFFTDTVAQDCTDSDNNPYLDVESHTLVLNDASGNFAAQIKLVRSVGTKNLAGTYTVKEYAHEDLTAGNGFDLGVYFGMPAGAYVIGSYYLKDGAVVIIEPGATITVSDAGEGVYSIDGDGFSFLTAPEGWVPGGVSVCDMTDTVAQDCTDADNNQYLDVESHTLVLKDGEEFVAQIKLIRSVGTTDLAGTYTVKEYAHEDLTVGNGFDLGVYFGMPAGAYIIGSYYIKDGAAVIVEPGETITVTSAGENTYKFEGSSDWTFVGKLAAGGDQPGEQDNWDYTPSAAYNASNNLWKSTAAGHENFYYYSCTGGDWNGTDTVTQEPPFLTKKESTYKLTYEANTNDRWQNQFFITTLDGNHIALDAAKTYKFSVTVGSTESFGAFFKLEQYDANHAKHEGATIWEPEGYPNNINLTAGSPVTLEHEFTGVEGPSINLVFDFGGNPAGAVVYIKDITLVEVGGDVPPVQTVELGQFLSLTSYIDYGANLVGMNLASADLVYTPADWAAGIYQDSYTGSGNMLKLELYSTDGSVAPGSYKACAVGGTVGEGEFGIGYDGMWGASGTTWYTITDGTPDKGVYVTDGTVDVSVDGGVYTIELKSSVVNAKYVGKLSAGGAEEQDVLFLNEFDCKNKKLEIYNPNDKEIDLTGWQLVKDGGLEDKDIYTIPASLAAAKVPAKGYAVFSCKSSKVEDGPLFGLSGTKGFKIELKNGSNVVDVVDNLTAPVQIPDGKSWGRETDGAENFVIFDTPTIGASNGPEAVKITIDGNMSDWAAIEGTVLEPTGAEGEEGAQAIKELKGFVDADYVYVYVKRVKLGRWTQLFGSGNAGYYYFDFDLDNNPETGDHAEHAKGSFESWCFLYIFGGSADAPEFRATPAGEGHGMKIDNVLCNGCVTADAVEVEVRFPRADLAEITADSISVSVWGNKDGNPFTKVTFPAK